MKEIIIATGNKFKLEEIKSILTGYKVIGMEEAGFYEDIVEDGLSFEENALIKAKAIHEKTGGIVLGDDSGLMVEYLNGAPGIYSARYAGEEKDDRKNNNKLLKELNSVCKEDRLAKFVCCVGICYEDGTCEALKGEVKGTIGFEEIGDGGFGYDPLFFIEELNKTYAELSFEEKNMVSHRRKAFEKAKDILDKKYK